MIPEAGSLRKREKPVTGYAHRIPASICRLTSKTIFLYINLLNNLRLSKTDKLTFY
jgi:hypothetical protein